MDFLNKKRGEVLKNARKNTFQPKQSLEGKSNYKKYYRVELDGTVRERIFLNVPDIAQREEIICLHYLQFLVQNFLVQDVGINFVSRDNPWDFGVELSNGLAFNVEITSIAENAWSYEKMKREELYEQAVAKYKIKSEMFRKICRWFGHKKLEEECVKTSELIDNPLFGEGARIFTSSSKKEVDSLAVLIQEAIERKNSKKHNDKEKTILIIDNRTSRFEVEDFFKAMDELGDKLILNPFPEIYFYTGYYSDNDGNKAEYSFAPIKMPYEKWKRIEARVKSGELVVNKNGVAYD
jgi:predicted lactoylglutathione lyase